MISEIQVPVLTEQQSSALRIFRNRCSIIGIGALLLAVGSWLIFIVLDLESATKTLALVLFLLAISYLLLMLIVMWRRTGLWWHFLNDQPGWVVAPVAMAGLGLWAIFALQPAVRLSSWLPFVLFIPFLIAMLSWALQQWLRSWAQARAEVERVRYSKHWIRLAQVSLRDMALFRIPHERA